MQGIKIQIENIDELNELINTLNRTLEDIEKWQPKIVFDLSEQIQE